MAQWSQVSSYDSTAECFSNTETYDDPSGDMLDSHPLSNTETYDDPFGEGYLLTPESQTETASNSNDDLLSRTETASNSDDDFSRDEIEELGQLITEEVPKIKKWLSKLVTNHKTLDAGQKYGAAAMLVVSIAAALVFLSVIRYAHIKAKNVFAANTIKEQNELCCKIDDSVKKMTDKLESIVSSGRQSNGAVPAERINKTATDLLLYHFKSDVEGYEYKSDILVKVECVRADIARIKSAYDLLTKYLKM